MLRRPAWASLLAVALPLLLATGIEGSTSESTSPEQGSALSWGHGWGTAMESYWGDFRSPHFLTDGQAEFLAQHYNVISLEKCTARSEGVDTEAAIYRTSRQLKAKNPRLRVMFYWSVEQAGVSCYAAGRELLKHPEWWLRDDHGNPVLNKGHENEPLIDPTNANASAWWLQVPFSEPDAETLIDGVLADGVGYHIFANFSVARLEAYYAAKLDLIGRLQDKFTALNGGVVFGNGLSQYDLNPKVDPHNLRILDHVNGVQNEHYAAFEQVDHHTGKLLVDKVSDVLDLLERVSHNASAPHKQIFCSFWAGPYAGFSHGWPAYAHGPQPQGYVGWQKQLKKYFPFNVASFLLVAGPNTWFTQTVWYTLDKGFVTCPEDPTSCAAPPDWYPDLKKPLGAPLGPRKQVGKYKWVREFVHAHVYVDLEDPLASSVIFRNDK